MKIKKLVALILAMSLLLVFAGCKNEDKEHDSRLIGTWTEKVSKNDEGSAVWLATLEFNEDGTYCMYQTDEQVRTYIETHVEEEFKTEEHLKTQLKLLGLKTKEDLINKYLADYVKESKPQEKNYLYWKTEDGQIKYYTSKADYESGNYNKDMTKNYEISEDGKVLTAGNIKLGNPESYDDFEKVS